MLSKTEEQLLDVVLQLEQQQQEVTVANVTSVLTSQQQELIRAKEIEEYVEYWSAAMDTNVDTAHPPFLLKIAFFFHIKYGPKLSHYDHHLARALGIDAEHSGEGVTDTVLRQKVQKKAESIVTFWRSLADQLYQNDERSKTPLTPEIRKVVETLSSHEDEQAYYTAMRCRQLVNRRVRVLATQGQVQVTQGNVEQIASDAATIFEQSSVELLRHYVMYLSFVEVRQIFLEEYCAVFGVPLPEEGFKEQKRLESTIDYLQEHPNVDHVALAAILKTNVKETYAYVEKARTILLDTVGAKDLRQRFEELKKVYDSHENIPDGTELYCLYGPTHLMRVSHLEITQWNVAVTLDDGKQGFVVDWIDVKKLLQLENSLGWRSVAVVESTTAISPATETLKNVYERMKQEPTIGGLLKIGEHLLLHSPTVRDHEERSREEDAPPLQVAEPSQAVLPNSTSDTSSEPLTSEEKLEKTVKALRSNPELTDEEIVTLLQLHRPAAARFWRLKAQEILDQEHQVLVTPDDRLQVTVNALRANPNLTDEEIATLLNLRRSASARFWKIKAQEVLSLETKTSPSSPRLTTQRLQQEAVTAPTPLQQSDVTPTARGQQEEDTSRTQLEKDLVNACERRDFEAEHQALLALRQLARTSQDDLLLETVKVQLREWWAQERLRRGSL